MTSTALPTGPFTCEFSLRRIRAPEFRREDRDGVTYLVARDYETAYETVLRFENGSELPIRGRLIGELNRRVIVRDARGRPVKFSGYVQGRTEIHDTDGHVLFRGPYYDSRATQALAGDDALTPVGPAAVDHWENGFGEGPYAGHAFSMGVQATRDGDGPLRGEGRGHID